jgi:hypothetical protein
LAPSFQLKLLDVEDGDFFDVKFIVDSVEANTLKPLLDYRLNRTTAFTYSGADELQQESI